MTRKDILWAQDAAREIDQIVGRQRSIAFPLAATLNTPCPVWFVDERRKFAGSHKVHLVAAHLRAALADGRVGQDTTLVLDSCGTTALALALMAQAIGLRCRLFCPLSTARVKLRYLRQLGVEINLAGDLEGAGEAARAAAGAADAVHLDQFSEPLRDDGYGAGLIDAVTGASGRLPTDLVTCIGSGGSFLSMSRAVAARGIEANVHVADLPDGQFATGRRGPGHSIDGLNQEFRPPCLSGEVLDSVLDVAEHEAFAAAVAMREGCGESVGPTTGLVLAAALRRQGSMLRDGAAGLICVPIYDAAERYPHKLANRDFLEALGDEFDSSLVRYMDVLCRPDAERAA